MPAEQQASFTPPRTGSSRRKFRLPVLVAALAALALLALAGGFFLAHNDRVCVEQDYDSFDVHNKVTLDYGAGEEAFDHTDKLHLDGDNFSYIKRDEDDEIIGETIANNGMLYERHRVLHPAWLAQPIPETVAKTVATSVSSDSASSSICFLPDYRQGEFQYVGDEILNGETLRRYSLKEQPTEPVPTPNFDANGLRDEYPRYGEVIFKDLWVNQDGYIVKVSAQQDDYYWGFREQNIMTISGLGEPNTISAPPVATLVPTPTPTPIPMTAR